MNIIYEEMLHNIKEHIDINYDSTEVDPETAYDLIRGVAIAIAMDQDDIYDDYIELCKEENCYND
jgi:hypothetical protein